MRVDTRCATLRREERPTILLLLLACTAPNPTEAPVPTGDSEVPSGDDTADTGLSTPTGDTGPACVPRAVPDPAGGPPTLFLPPIATASGAEDYDWLEQVFLLDSVVGYALNSNVPGNDVHTSRWDPMLAPGAGIQQEVSPGGAADVGDLTGDGIDDLVVWFEAGDTPEYVIAPGPLAQISAPALTHPDTIPAPWAAIAFGQGRIPHCGDLNGDGLEDLCSTSEVHLTPFDGTADWTRPGDFYEQGLAADMDGDGVNELYIASGSTVERFTLSAAGTGPPPGVFEGLEASYWAMDLDEDGVDSLYTPGPGNMKEITAAGFIANTVLRCTPRGVARCSVDGTAHRKRALGPSTSVMSV
jgi:hypothetical protein